MHDYQGNRVGIARPAILNPADIKHLPHRAGFGMRSVLFGGLLQTGL